MYSNNAAVVDLFCGIGGLTNGFLQEHFNVCAGIDSDKSCKYAYTQNNLPSKFINKKIEDITADEIEQLYPDGVPKILVGCAPCQPFSSYTNGQPQDQKKWGLLTRFSEIITRVKPDVVSMENVTRLRTFRGGEILNSFIQKLECSGYSVSVNEVYCPNYGIPQSRTRLVLLASSHGKIKLVEPTHQPKNYITVRETIGHLPRLEAGKSHKNDRLHISSSLSPTNTKRIQASIPGGTWRDWPEDLIAKCHKKRTGKSYPSVYGRMEWDKPSPTITTQFYGFGNGRFGHPEQNRAISLREGSLLQTFPASYAFVNSEDEVMIKIIGRHIGNAVPVQLGKMIAKSVRMHLESIDV